MPDAGVPEGDRLALLRSVVDTFFEPSLLVRRVEDRSGPEAALAVLAANTAASERLSIDPASGHLIGRPLSEAMPWAAASGLLAALYDVMETGVPLRIHGHAYEEPAAPDEDAGARSVSVGAMRIEPGLMLVTMRPELGGDGTDAAWEEKLHRLSGTGPWEWDVSAGTVRWYAQALAVLGSGSDAGPHPADEPPYRVHHEDEADHEAFLQSLTRDARPGHVEVRVLQPAGGVRHIRFGGEPAADGQGRVVRVYGSVQDVTVRRRAQTALDIARVQLAARRSRGDSERQLAGLLQQVIMPTGPIPGDLAGLEVAARYRPATAAAGVGGDWYGATPLGDGKVLLHIGDVAGHGFPAATAMARLYHALQGLAVTGAGPARMLHWLNTLTCELSDFTLASACCAVFDPRRRRLTLANAGHPSPVFVRDRVASTLTKPANGMLGIAPDTVYEEQEITVASGDMLLLYTDGLIERRRRAPEENTAVLLAHAAAANDDIEAYADGILYNARSDTDDDACLLAVRFL